MRNPLWLPKTDTFAFITDPNRYKPIDIRWALYEVWLTRRNEWSVQESIFHHFWYEVAVVLASFLADETEPRIQLTLPTIRF